MNGNNEKNWSDFQESDNDPEENYFEQILDQSKEKIEKKHLMERFSPFINKQYADLKFAVDKLDDFRRLKALFNKKLGYELNLDDPKSFNEKIQWKKIYDRNPLLTVTSDKYEVRSYVENVLGEKVAQEILIPLYYVTNDPETIPFDKLPDSFVIKPNHGSSMHLIINKYKDEFKELILQKCKSWLRKNHGLYNNEWAYRDIKRKILVEKLLDDKEGGLPMDYKLFCFHGKCKYIRVSENRFNKRDDFFYLDTDWNLIPLSVVGNNKKKQDMVQIPEKPQNYKRLLDLGEKLSSAFDSVRVDFYDFGGKIYFGELTHYSACGFRKYDPVSFDYEMGSHWKLQKDYWLK
jgi:hypothetical protein